MIRQGLGNRELNKTGLCHGGSEIAKSAYVSLNEKLRKKLCKNIDKILNMYHSYI